MSNLTASDHVDLLVTSITISYGLAVQVVKSLKLRSHYRRHVKVNLKGIMDMLYDFGDVPCSYLVSLVSVISLSSFSSLLWRSTNAGLYVMQPGPC